MAYIYPLNNPGGVHLTVFDFTHLAPPPTKGWYNQKVFTAWIPRLFLLLHCNCLWWSIKLFLSYSWRSPTIMTYFGILSFPLLRIFPSNLERKESLTANEIFCLKVLLFYPHFCSNLTSTRTPSWLFLLSLLMIN